MSACSMPDKKAPWAVEKYLSWHASPANKTIGVFCELTAFDFVSESELLTGSELLNELEPEPECGPKTGVESDVVVTNSFKLFGALETDFG